MLIDGTIRPASRADKKAPPTPLSITSQLTQSVPPPTPISVAALESLESVRQTTPTPFLSDPHVAACFNRLCLINAMVTNAPHIGTCKRCCKSRTPPIRNNPYSCVAVAGGSGCRAPHPAEPRRNTARQNLYSDRLFSDANGDVARSQSTKTGVRATILAVGWWTLTQTCFLPSARLSVKCSALTRLSPTTPKMWRIKTIRVSALSSFTSIQRLRFLPMAARI